MNFLACNEDTALSDLMSLLLIPAPPAQEQEVISFLIKTLREWGVPEKNISLDKAHLQSEYGGNSGNLIVRFEGQKKGSRRLFSAHVDTVPDAVGAIPERDGEWIVNRAIGKALGGDNRTGCAVLLHLARTLLNLKGNHLPITLAFLIQEEVGLIGSRGLDVSLLGEPKPAMAFNIDSSDPEGVVVAITGTERLHIDIEGIPAHAGANPESGVSAAVVAALAIAELVRTGWHGPIDNEQGTGSANVGVLNGGTGTNVVMPHLHIFAEARSHSKEFRSIIFQRWKRAFESSAAAVSNTAGQHATLKYTPGPYYEAFALAEDSDVVKLAMAAVSAAGGTPRCLPKNNGGMDSNWLVAHGIPTAALGAGQSRVHTPDEKININQFKLACRIIEKLGLL